MVALGMLMALVGFWSLWLRRSGALFTSPFFHRVAVCMAPAGFIALLCGWVTTEVGRQPWTVYGLLRTSESVSPIVLSSMAVTMTAFVVVYVIVFGSLIMMDFAYWLPIVWAVILVAAITIYVILDGFDLGIGMLFALERDQGRRDVMVNTIAPVWDGNETWMVLGGAVLYGVFPGAYATLLPALYLPIVLMLLALIFRGVSFEFRVMTRGTAREALWEVGFMAGSGIAAFSQGVILGGVIQGIAVTNGEFTGGALDWLTPFSVLCGLAVMCGYALLGATWLVW
uniref:Cytochrome d ubiquinol oxidase subunit II n=1 Tax=Anopheles maculatus TaxID=74869 RepID=A0A182SAE5_9DIPT